MKVKRKSYKPNIGHYNVTRLNILIIFLSFNQRSYEFYCFLLFLLFFREMYVCPALAQIIRAEKASRGQIVKRVWLYIKAKQLQCKGRGRVIRPDERLASLLGIAEGIEVDGFTLMRHLENHIRKRRDDSSNKELPSEPQAPSEGPSAEASTSMHKI